MGKMFSDVAPIRVLLVEDEFLIGEWIAEALGEQGFAVHTVSNARDALRHLASAPVDVLFTDINLPGGMDGRELAQKARQLRPDLPIVYASGRYQPTDMGALVPRSVFLSKPYDPYDVGTLLTRLTERAH